MCAEFRNNIKFNNISGLRALFFLNVFYVAVVVVARVRFGFSFFCFVWEEERKNNELRWRKEWTGGFNMSFTMRFFTNAIEIADFILGHLFSFTVFCFSFPNRTFDFLHKIQIVIQDFKMKPLQFATPTHVFEGEFFYFINFSFWSAIYFFYFPNVYQIKLPF